MTRLLEKAFEEASRLPEVEQTHWRNGLLTSYTPKRIG